MSQGWLGVQYSFLFVHVPNPLTESDAAVELAVISLGYVAHVISRMNPNASAIRDTIHKIESTTKPGRKCKDAAINSFRDT